MIGEPICLVNGEHIFSVPFRLASTTSAGGWVRECVLCGKLQPSRPRFSPYPKKFVGAYGFKPDKDKP